MTGLILCAADYKSPVSAPVEANLFEGNYDGMHLYTDMATEDSEVLVLANNFKDNRDFGLLLPDEGNNVKAVLVRGAASGRTLPGVEKSNPGSSIKNKTVWME